MQPSTKMPTVNFQGVECTLQFQKYAAGRGTRIQLWSPDGPYATATVNVPGVRLADGEVIIKDYDENAGMLATLTSARVVSPTGRTVRVGHVVCQVCRLLV